MQHGHYFIDWNSVIVAFCWNVFQTIQNSILVASYCRKGAVMSFEQSHKLTGVSILRATLMSSLFLSLSNHDAICIGVQIACGFKCQQFGFIMKIRTFFLRNEICDSTEFYKNAVWFSVNSCWHGTNFFLYMQHGHSFNDWNSVFVAFCPFFSNLTHLFLWHVSC